MTTRKLQIVRQFQLYLLVSEIFTLSKSFGLLMLTLENNDSSVIEYILVSKLSTESKYHHPITPQPCKAAELPQGIHTVSTLFYLFIFLEMGVFMPMVLGLVFSLPQSLV